MTEIGNPSRHKVSHQDGGRDELDLSGLAGQQIWVPYNSKIADITHADTNKHTIDLASPLAETRNIIGVLLYAQRISGSGSINAYPNEGTYTGYLGSTVIPCLIIISPGTNRLQYALNQSNDDWDLYCIGYIVEA